MRPSSSQLARVRSDGFGESQRLAGSYLDFAGRQITRLSDDEELEETGSRQTSRRASRAVGGVAPPRKTLTTLAAGRRPTPDPRLLQ